MVEVLCCCAVVALLSGLLLPALSGAREAGRAAACSSNLRQLGLANELYASDNRSNYAPGAPDFLVNRTRWFGARSNTSQVFDSEGGPLSSYTGGAGQAARRCASFKPATGGGAFERGCGGYGYNNAFVGVRAGTIDGTWRVLTDRSGAAAATFSNPAAVVGFTDAGLYAGDPAGRVIEYSFAEPRLWPGAPSGENARPDPSIHFRHDAAARLTRVPGVANVAWLDGHVSSVQRGFTWSSGIYGSPSQDPQLGWPGQTDDNQLFGGR